MSSMSKGFQQKACFEDAYCQKTPIKTSEKLLNEHVTPSKLSTKQKFVASKPKVYDGLPRSMDSKTGKASIVKLFSTKVLTYILKTFSIYNIDYMQNVDTNSKY